MFGMSPALKIAFAVMPGTSNPPSRLRYEPSIFRSVSLATRFKAVQCLRQGVRYRVSFTGATGSGASTKPLLSHDRDDLLTRLMFVAGIADIPSPPFLAIVLVPSPCRMLRSRWCWLRQMSHAGDERLCRASRRQPISGEHLVDGRVVDQGGPVARSAVLACTSIAYPYRGPTGSD